MGGTPTACEKCRRPTGPSCGLALSRAAEAGACVRCWAPTTVYSLCGVPRHYDCQPPRQAPRDPDMVTEQATLRAALAEASLSGQQINRGVKLWDATMRGLTYTGPHTTALKILNGVFSWPAVPKPPTWRPEWLAPLSSGPMWQARSWLDTDAAPAHVDGYDLVAFDVNGMYLSAAACELGTGAPERLEWPPDTVLDRPGYVQTSTLETAPYGLLSRWEEGMWMPTPIARYLYDDGHQFLITAALIWRDHRRWLGPHVDLLRAARTTLIEAGDPAALAVLAILKEVYTRMIGLVGSVKYNPDGAGLNEHWHDMIPATGQARMLRGLDRVRHKAVSVSSPVVGIHADAAWYLLPRGWPEPIGLEISTQLGKFKAGRRGDGTPQRVPWTAELHEAYQAGEHATLRAALSPRVEVTV